MTQIEAQRMMTNDNQDVGIESVKRTPLESRDTEQLVKVASEYRLSGVDWDYYNVMTGILRYTFEQPEGFAGHIAWQGEGEWRVLNLWASERLREKFFVEHGIERLSKGINLLGAVKGPEGVTDVKPQPFKVEKFILGPRAAAFTEIGEDRDGSAITALGGETVAIELEVSGMTADEYETLVARLGYGSEIPAELISHHATAEDDGMRIFETWSSSGHALVALGSLLLPAIERLGEETDREFLCFHIEYALQRIVFSSDVVDAFGFN
jgi:hypothetical protein